MRIIITGSRNWKNPFIISKAIEGYIDNVFGEPIIVHGQCPTGADYWADLYAKSMGYEVEPHPALWEVHGKFAGPKRNMEMVDLGADIVLGFLHPNSRGTVHCLKYAKEKGLPTEVYKNDIA